MYDVYELNSWVRGIYANPSINTIDDIVCTIRTLQCTEPTSCQAPKAYPTIKKSKGYESRDKLQNQVRHVVYRLDLFPLVRGGRKGTVCSYPYVLR